MVLRPDEPELYCYSEGRWAEAAYGTRLLHQLVTHLNKVRVLLWILIVLTGLIVIRVWK